MDTLVDSQGRALDELLATIGIIADMRSHSRVDSLCSQSQSEYFSILKWCMGGRTVASKVATSREALLTSTALICLRGGLRRGVRSPPELRRGVHVRCHGGKCHATGSHVRLGHVQRCVHGSWGSVWASVLQIAVHWRLRVSRVFGSVG